MLKVGIVGIGVAGFNQIQAFNNIKDARVVAISDVNKEALISTSNKYGIKNAYTDYRDLIKFDEIDVVNVCTPPFLHASITIEAAKAGKHVLCEKPMAMNAKEASEMVQACKKANVKLGICSARRRFDPSIEKAKKFIDEGKLGKVYYTRFSFFHRRWRLGIDVSPGITWFLDSKKAGGGALVDIGCYDLDSVLYLLGSPQPLSVSAMTFSGIGDHPPLKVPYDVEEHSSVFVRFEGGITAMFETATASNMESGSDYLIFGTKGGLKLNPFTYYTKLSGENVGIIMDPGRLKTGDELLLMLKDFVSACLENKNPKTPGEDGLKTMQITSMAYKSAEIKREVDINMI